MLRRARRRVKLPKMLARLQGQFEGLVSSIRSQVQSLTDLAVRNLAISPETRASFLARLQRLIWASRRRASEKVGKVSE